MDDNHILQLDRQRDNVMDDLLLRFPSGKQGRLRKSDYEMFERWSQSAGVDRMTPSLIDRDSSTEFGWPVEDIVKAFWRADEDIRQYVRTRWPDLSSKAVTRRYNRLQDRVQPAVRKFQRSEGPGIWKAGERYGNRCMFVSAASKEAAKVLASTMFAGAGVIIEDHWFEAKRVMVNDPEALLFYNKKNIESVKVTLETSEKRIEELVEKVKSLRDLHNTLKAYETLQHEILTS